MIDPMRSWVQPSQTVAARHPAAVGHVPRSCGSAECLSCAGVLTLAGWRRSCVWLQGGVVFRRVLRPAGSLHLCNCCFAGQVDSWAGTSVGDYTYSQCDQPGGQSRWV